MSDAAEVIPPVVPRRDGARKDVRTADRGAKSESKRGAEGFFGRIRAGLAAGSAGKDKTAPATADAAEASEAAPEQAESVLERLRTLTGGAERSAQAVEDPEAEVARIRAAAQALGTAPILDGDDLKYEGMQPLSGSSGDKALLDWIKRNASNKLSIRVKRRDRSGDADAGAADFSQSPVTAWIITNDPNGAEVAAIETLMELKEWHVVVKPATRTLVQQAVVKDQALSPTEVEDKFRQLIADAVDQGASDIHFEVRGDRGITRFRINGEMQEVKTSEGYALYTRAVIEQFGNYMFNRLAKRGARQFTTTMALNASAQLKVRDDAVALRFATAPDIRGVDIFVRVWKPDEKAITLDQLGYREDHIKMLNRAIRRPYGVIVFSGPTGSGKSSSLTALLDSLEDEEKERRKIISLEEPVERELTHVTHVSVSGIVDHGGWKALLAGLNRWDSNVNVLGEIKDADTALAIMDLATSGKLSLTTLHASNVLSIPSRMEDLGVDHKLLYDSNFLVLLVNQRLVPKLCTTCRLSLSDDEKLTQKLDRRREELRAREVGQEILARLDSEFWEGVQRFRDMFKDHSVNVRGTGCDACSGSGIVGRRLVAEMVTIDDYCREFIRDRNWDGWRSWLQREYNWPSIRDDVCRYICDGIVDPEDAERIVCSFDDFTVDDDPRWRLERK